MAPIVRTLLAVALLAPAAAQAQEDRTCRNGLFPTQNPEFGLARVAAARLSFLSDLQGCPSAAVACLARAYTVAGDRLITGRTMGAYTCALFPNRQRTAGWVETAALRALPVPAAPPPSAWVGRWSDAGNPTVAFRVVRGRLNVNGEAYWPSPDTDRPGGPHYGEVEGPVALSGRLARDPRCNVRWTLLGSLMVGSDPDMRCGGANVSFSGVYRRTR